MKPSSPTEIQTYSGLYFDYANFDKDSIDKEDVAYALSLLCRYNGHCVKLYSIAQHLCLVHDLMIWDRDVNGAFIDTDLLFHGLIHDVGEAYLSDIPRPLKNYFQTDPNLITFFKAYEVLEDKIINEFSAKFKCGEHEPHKKRIKFYDNWALVLEQKYIMKQTREKEWGIKLQDFPPEPPFVKKLIEGETFFSWFGKTQTEVDWKNEFLKRLRQYEFYHRIHL